MATKKDLSEDEANKRERKITRTLFTKNANTLDAMLLECTEKELSIPITAQYLKVQELQNQLSELDRDIRRLMRDDDEDNLEKEMENALEYRSRWIILDCKYKDKFARKSPVKEEKQNFKLPTLQFIKFDGELKSWLPFWGQFQKIDEDCTIDMHDKYQYLIQAMKEDSEPRLLVGSFNSTSYKECLDQLKARYAREELLIQVYVRELLGMIHNIENQTITSLYDKLSAQLRALETLGVTKDKYAAFLLPMVESALPQELLKIWERTKSTELSQNNSELSHLLTFLRKEVESEQRIALAKKNFETHEIDEIPTAGCLLTGAKPITPQSCVLCDKNTHNSLECYKIQKMSVEERRALLKKKKACAICLKRGHHPKFCKSFIKCVVCGQRHAVVLCTGIKHETKDNSQGSMNHTATKAEFPSTSIRKD